jgi:hypothetical protein
MNDRLTAQPEPVPDTTRQRLNRIRRVTAFFIVIGSISFFGSIVVVFHSPLVAYLLLIVSGIFNPIGLIIRALAGRCGQCDRRISRAFCFAGWPWKISSALRFCPYCATSIDEPHTHTHAAGDVPQTFDQ